MTYGPFPAAAQARCWTPRPVRSHLVKSAPFLLPVCIALLAGCSQAPAPADSAAAPATPAAASAVAAVARPAKTYRIEDFVESTSLGGASFSHDESRLLFSSNRSGVWQVYRMRADGTDLLQLTFVGENKGADWSKKPE